MILVDWARLFMIFMFRGWILLVFVLWGTVLMIFVVWVRSLMVFVFWSRVLMILMFWVRLFYGFYVSGWHVVDVSMLGLDFNDLCVLGVGALPQSISPYRTTLEELFMPYTHGWLFF